MKKLSMEIFLVAVAILVVGTFTQDLSGQVIVDPDEYNQRLEEAIQQQEDFKTNEQYITNMMRGAMMRYPNAGWYYLDHFLGNGPQTTATFMGDIPIIDKDDRETFNLGIMFTFMAYMLDADNVNINLIGGLDFYFPERRIKIFAGIYMSADPEKRRISDEQAERYASGDDIITDGRMVEPYIFIDSPLTRFLRVRFDTNIASSFDEMYRLGAGAFLRLMRYNLLGLYDEIRIPGGKEKNVALGGRMGEGDLVSNPNAEVMPHIMIKIGSLYAETKYDDEQAGLNDSDSRYIIVKWIPPLKKFYHSNFIFGGSYKGSDGPGLQAGIFEWEDNLYWLFTVQYNYLLIDTFGSRINKWSYVFKISNAF